MRRVILGVAALALVCIGQGVAVAGPIDPIIGVRGLRQGDSQQITDPTAQGFVPCSNYYDDMSGFICAAFNLSETFANGLYGVDLTFADGGEEFAFEDLTINSEFAGFTQFERVGDTNTIRLFGGAGPNGALACPQGDDTTSACVGRADFIESPGFLASFIYDEGPAQGFAGDDAIVFFSLADRYGNPIPTEPNAFSVSATNPQNTPVVPEPGTLLLMGTGAVAMVRRYRRTA